MDQIDYLMAIQNTPIVTTHSDGHLDNFMYCEATGKLTMIDLECMHPFPVAYDLACLFAMYERPTHHIDKVHPRDKQAVWLIEYLNHLGHTGDGQKQLIEDYLDSIEIMLPLAIIYILIMSIMLGEGQAREHNV